MKSFIICAALLVTGILTNAQDRPISIIDFVKIKDNNRAEALFYYENNWKVYREIALQKKYISSYRLLSVVPDSISNFDLILITEFADSSSYKLVEENFREIIKSIRPNGNLLLNEKKPAEFRQSVFLKIAEVLIPEKL